MSSLASPAIQHPLDQEDRPVPRPISVIPAEAGTHRTTGTKREFVPSGTMAPGLSPSRSQSFASAEQGRRDDGWEEDLPETESRAVQGATVRSADIRVSDKSLNIEIVDLRTFHAPASDGQASAGVRAVIDLVPSGPERAAPTAFNPNLDAPRSEVRHLKIKLQPEHLGELTASLKLRGDELRVDIETHTGVALETIRHDEGILREALRNAGFDTATLTIVLSPASKDTVQAAATTDFAGQPQSFGERPEGDGRSQAEREKQRGFATRENSWSETDDQADPDASAPRRADGIFL
jgi:flagellar hook-length control protein FliK